MPAARRVRHDVVDLRTDDILNLVPAIVPRA
jgi:hypothetical protein